jgi:D-alanyl-D-alanine carboxypeptidase
MLMTLRDLHSNPGHHMPVLLKSLPFLIACLAAPLSAQLPTASRIEAAIDSIVQSEVLARGVPGVSLVITRGDKTLFERSWGFADVEAKRPADASTTYRTGSIAKQFTAALVMKQVDRARIALGDTIGKYVSGLKPEWTGLVIEQLLNHTSGVPRDFRDPRRAGENMSTDSLLALARRSTAPTEKPGAKFIYSNTGYMLLGALVEKLYGMPYGTIIRDQIARPLGLSSLSACADVDATAKAYIRPPSGELKPAPFLHPSLLLGNGSICSTARDLARWNRALHSGKVVSPASYAAMTTPTGVAAQANVPYGFGLYVRQDLAGNKVIVHDGSTVGYNAENVWYPAQQLSLTMLYNRAPSLGLDLNITEAMARVILGVFAAELSDTKR